MGFWLPDLEAKNIIQSNYVCLNRENMHKSLVPIKDTSRVVFQDNALMAREQEVQRKFILGL